MPSVPDVVIATDALGVYREVASVLEAPDTTIRWATSGPLVARTIDDRPTDLAVLDLQIGAMGGIAVALDLRLEADAGRLMPTPVLLLLDRRADVFLARRSGVEGWLLKPLDPIRVRKAAAALLGGGTWYDTTGRPDPVAVPFGAA